MTEKKLDEILFIVKGIEDKILSMLKPQSQETFKKELKETFMVQTVEGDPIPDELELGATYKIEQDVFEYEGKTYNLDKFKPCKYKCSYWTGWGQPYVKGDKILHINPANREVIGFQCPKFEGR